MTNRIHAAAIGALFLAVNAAAAPMDEQHSMPMGHEAMHAAAPPETRELVHFPAPLLAHELANMRDHLAQRHEVGVGHLAQPFAARDELGAVVAEVRDRAAEGCQAEL